MIYILLGQPKSVKKILSRLLHSKLKKIQGLFKGLAQKFKDFSRKNGIQGLFLKGLFKTVQTL